VLVFVFAASLLLSLDGRLVVGKDEKQKTNDEKPSE
jgi:hypothetical protein